MNTIKKIHKALKNIAKGFIFCAIATNVHAAATDLASSPLVTSSASEVLPNVFFILDDSGSMDWAYMPDWANSGNASLFRNSDYNGVAYNPATTYTPPTFYNSDGTVNTSSYPSQTGLSTATGASSSSKPNWKKVKNDGYGVQSTSTSDLTSDAYFYLFKSGESCASSALRDCIQGAPTASYPVPAKLRWCSTSSDAIATVPTAGKCQAVRFETGTTPLYNQARTPGLSSTTTLKVNGSTATTTTVGSIKVNGIEILSGTTTATYTDQSSNGDQWLAYYITNAINDCTAAATGNCQVAGYSASRSGADVTITSPDGSGAISDTPVVTNLSGSLTISSSAFSGGVPGLNIYTVIDSSNNSYPFPGAVAKASTRTDCAGTTCTYVEEMTNYANWYSYYRTRMQMMKTATSIAFQPINTNYRVGYMSINVNKGDFAALDQFTGSSKTNWYQKLFAADPNNGTPLRSALTAAGRYYAGKKATYTSPASNKSISMSDDPMQYSCQQNFTILSTDGYWNAGNGYQVDGSTIIGNEDGTEPRPFNDGTVQLKSTSQLQQTVSSVTVKTHQILKKTVEIQRRTSSLQTRTSTLQKVTGTLQTRTASNYSNSFGGWSNTGSCTWDNNKPNRRQCRYVDSAPTNVASCTTDAESTNTSNGQTWNGNATTCTYSTPTSWANTSSCTEVNGSSGSPFTVATARECQYSAPTSWAYVATCTNVPESTSPSYAEDTAVECKFSNTGFVGAASCIASSSPGLDVTCDSVSTGPDLVDSCTGAAASAGNSYTLTTCTPTTLSQGGVSSCTAGVDASHVRTSCNTVTTGPTAVASCTAAAASGSNDWTTTTCAAGTGGTSNTLADVAEYYYKTDLRTVSLNNCTGANGNTLCSTPIAPETTDPYNNVPSGNLDANAAQHMTTFTLGLGASGYMQYSPTYATDNSGDYFNVSKGTASNASGGICNWQSSGTCNWPTPASDKQTAIDDLWHAGVNGRGAYFSATNPASLSSSLASALSGVSARTGASAAATTSNPNITSGDNFVFSSTFTTQDWDGELVRQQLDLTTGATSATIDWAAQALLEANTTRTIYTYNSADAADGLNEFTAANYGANINFSTAHISSLSQFCTTGVTCLSSADQTTASGNNLVSFLRGDRTNEGIAADTSKYYRLRKHILGDIVNAEAVYVKGSLFNYSDLGYSNFVTSNASRRGMVYVAANDGMLHAFYAADDTGIVGGNEAWAFIPSLVVPNLYKLADKNYQNLHQFFVDGTPVVGDICLSTSDCTAAATAVWKTLLVGGLNLGGRGYYAMDVTDPANPKALWEFTDANMGYTFGNPKITKLKDGTWVVLVTSGYNNIAPGDGKGYLYVINATTGTLIRKISTGVGSDSATVTGCSVAPCPSGLAKIAARVVNPSTDNTVEAVYGGDLFGNLWRFDVNDTIGASGYDAQLLAVLRGPGGNYQPITAKPEVGTVSSNKAVFVGTGSYLGASDLGSSDPQSIYGIKDPLTLGTTPSVAIYDNPRSFGGFIQQVQTNSVCPAGAPETICKTGQIVRTSSSNVVNFATDNGWYIDLPDGVGASDGSGSERANTDPALALGTLGFTTNVPNSNACTVGGFSYRYFLDYRTGAAVSTSTGNIVSTRLGNALATRPVYVRLPNNTVVELTRLSDGTTITSNVPIGGGAGVTRRTSWRELIKESE